MRCITCLLSMIGTIQGLTTFCVEGKHKNLRTSTLAMSSSSPSDDTTSSSRRRLLAIPFALSFHTFQDRAWAIDVSGLPVEGRGPAPELVQQLKGFDGSGSTRIKEIKAKESESAAPIKNKSLSDSQTKASSWAYRANPGFGPSLTRTGPIGNRYRYRDTVLGPPGTGNLGLEFEFPADWLQLDRASGGIQYVDQRNGDKLYVLRAALPENTNLDTLPKATLASIIFDPDGSLMRSGQNIEDYKVSSSKTLSDCPPGSCSTRRRFKMKYASVTGNGLRVERRGLVDAYQVSDYIYMLMTSSNAVKFEQVDSLERQTVEKIADSFQVGI